MSHAAFLKFYIMVINLERIYASREDAYEAAERQWMAETGQRRYQNWASFRNAICRNINDKVSFFTLVINQPNFPAIVATFLTQADCRKFIKSLEELDGATLFLFRTNDGRIRSYDQPVETIQHLNYG